MKIAHLIWSLGFGGIEAMIIDLVNEQVKQHDVHLIIINRKINQNEFQKINNKVKTYLVGRKVGSPNPFKFIRVNWLLHKIDADVVHCHIENLINVIPFYKKSRICLTVHDVRKQRKYLRKYDKLFAISNTVKNDIYTHAGLRSTLIYNGMNLSLIKRKNDYNFKKFKILQISRLDHEKKGQDVLLRAFSILIYNKNISNIQLDFIGDGKSLAYLKEIATELKIDEQVRFLGFKNRDYIFNHLKDYNLLVQPSNYEGFGMTVIEGITAGLPVLVSNIEGPMEIIQNGRYGYHFRVNDASHCAEMICQIMENIKSEKFQNQEKQNYDYIIKTFDIEKTAKNYIDNYFK